MIRTSAALLALSLAGSAIAAESYAVDPAHSSATFTISHFGIGQTAGRFNVVGGALEIDGKDASKNTVKVTIQAASIDTNNKQRDEHLSGPDFFNVKQYPTLEFVSSAWKPTGEKTAEVTGTLTIHGASKTITVPVVKVGEGDNMMMKAHGVGYVATFPIKRSDYEVKGLLGPVGDDVTITVSLEAYNKK